MTGPSSSSAPWRAATVGIGDGVLAEAPAALEHAADEHERDDADDHGEQDEAAVGRHPWSMAPTTVPATVRRVREACRLRQPARTTKFTSLSGTTITFTTSAVARCERTFSSASRALDERLAVEPDAARRTCPAACR